ncbi:MAG: stage 0 sporulation protein [Anaerolineae bacterium]|nr:stage 0 sporulation protein [Anaerolineae bacterium]
MALAAQQAVAGVRFTRVGRLYQFDVTAYPELGPGDYVVVETTRGRQLGQIIGMLSAEKVDRNEVKSIRGPATARDLMMKKLYEAKELETLIRVREVASKMALPASDIKFVKVSYNYDGSTMAVLFTSEELVDLGHLRRRLQSEFNARIDMRRIGARDAAKLLGEYGACGSPRCCSTHLTEFSPVSIKMAKSQGISLNPSEITGMCGRLRCCLVYEYEQYVEAIRHLPRKGKVIGTPHGEGRVIDVNPLRDSVTVVIEDTRHEVTREEIEHLDELRALQAKASAGCSKEGQAGPCECGARVRSGTPSQTAPSESLEPPVSAMPSTLSARPERQGPAGTEPAGGRPPRERRHEDHRAREPRPEASPREAPSVSTPSEEGQTEQARGPRRRRRRWGRGKPRTGSPNPQ